MHDLSIVTDTLRKIITDALAASPVRGGGPPPFSVSVSGQHPEAPAGIADCELSLYLFHIGPDKFLANSFWTQAAQSGGGAGKQPVAFEPLSLDLWYMLSAQAETSYQHEQQVLGVAMQALHEHGTFTLATPTPLPNPVTPSQATLVLESPTFDEMSRLWQALGVPLRTTAQYRVSVIFLTPDELPPQAPPVTTVTLVAASADAAPTDATLPQLFSTRRVVTYTAPGPTPESFTQSPASTAPAPGGVSGQEVSVDGIGASSQPVMRSPPTARDPIRRQRPAARLGTARRQAGNAATAIVSENRLVTAEAVIAAAVIGLRGATITGNIVATTVADQFALAVLLIPAVAITGNVVVGRAALPVNRPFPAPLDTWLPLNTISG